MCLFLHYLNVMEQNSCNFVLRQCVFYASEGRTVEHRGLDFLLLKYLPHYGNIIQRQDRATVFKDTLKGNNSCCSSKWILQPFREFFFLKWKDSTSYHEKLASITGCNLNIHPSPVC